jgi:ribulose-phosphate 3-epimerase
MRKQIIPSIIARTQEELDYRLDKVDFSPVIHLDVMDGKFVDNSSLDFDFNLFKIDHIFEAHLMIENPEEWIGKNWNKVDAIFVHIESCENPAAVINMIRDKGKRVGFVLNPKTSVDNIADFLGDIDQVLVMTVNPGFYGSRFLPEVLHKVKQLRALKPDLDIEVDGGINDKTIEEVLDAGANLFVSGSYIMNADDPQKVLDELTDLLE